VRCAPPKRQRFQKVVLGVGRHLVAQKDENGPSCRRAQAASAAASGRGQILSAGSRMRNHISTSVSATARLPAEGAPRRRRLASLPRLRLYGESTLRHGEYKAGLSPHQPGTRCWSS